MSVKIFYVSNGSKKIIGIKWLKKKKKLVYNGYK